jgi:hypothetical protein
MKVTKKPNAGNKRRRKGKGQARPQAQLQAQKESSGCLLGESKGKPREPTQPPFPDRLKTQPDGLERIRKLWEHKQGELESRWAKAQDHQARQDSRRKRAIIIGSSTASAVLVALLCIVAWFAA